MNGTKRFEGGAVRSLFRHLPLYAALAAALVPANLHASAQAPNANWAETLQRDARALHDTFAGSHPGAVDPENPGFRTQLQAGLARALDRAAKVSSWGGYWWAMREYVASFDDVHVVIETTPSAPELPLKWPGFLTREVDGRHIVASRADLAGVPPMGATLTSCDGLQAEELAARLVGRFRGRWNMSSQHQRHAWRLFLDADNPFVKMPSSCTFSAAGSERTYQLAWTALPKAAFEQEAKKVVDSFRVETGMRPFGSNGLWISAASFSGDTSSPNGRAIASLVATLEKQRAMLASADRIVLDVRGNGGGSSRWGNEIAELIWGKAIAQAAKPQSAGVDWRPSAGNIAAVQQHAKNPGMSFFGRIYMSQVESGLKKALAAGQPLWREKKPAMPALLRSAKPGPKKTGERKVYILADGSCASACLDAMDVWIRAGAIPIGRETDADSLYMEVRVQPLPSGLAKVTVPMKVYRGRPRGHNVSYKPVHRFDGDMQDQAAVEAWVSRLP